MTRWADRLAAPGARRAALLVALLASLALMLALGLQARARVLKKERLGTANQVNDFERWMRMTPQFTRDHADYVDDSFPNPPITLLFFAPLAQLSPANAQLAWALVKWGLVVAIVACCLSMAKRSGIRPTLESLALVLLVWIFPVVGDVQEGQTNLLMLLPLCAGLWAAQKAETQNAKRETQNHGHEVWGMLGGVLIALAACIKVTPIIFLVYFLWRRRWWVAAGMVVGIGWWLVILPGLVFGWRQNLTWLGQWCNIMIVPYVLHGHVDYFVGQSIPSFLSRLLRHVPAFTVDGGSPVYVNVLDWPESLVDWIVRGVLAAVALGGLWWMRRRLESLTCPRYLLECGALGIFMLWASQRTWVPHYVTLALACAGVAMVLSDGSEDVRFRRRAAMVVLGAAALMATTTDVARLLGKAGGEWVRTAGVSLAASLLLMLVLVRSRYGRRSS